MRKWLCVFFLCLVAPCVDAQTTTVVADTIRSGIGNSLFAGDMIITPPAGWVGTQRMVSVPTIISIMTGSFTVALVPNDTITPTTNYYQVRYRPTSGPEWTERWYVPTSTAPLKLSAVIVATVQPLSAIPYLPLAQLSPTGASNGQGIYYDAALGHWRPGAYGSGFPTVVSSWNTQIGDVTYAPGFVPVGDYNFTAIYPGQTLAPGSNTVSIAPCPTGVAGTDTRHYLYASGGTGTAEALLITGGTCTSGATSGTLVMTAANAHSGGWSLTSATGGMQEAVNALGTGGNIMLPAGTITLYATTFIQERILIAGQGSEITFLENHITAMGTASNHAFLFDFTTNSNPAKYTTAGLQGFAICGPTGCSSTLTGEVDGDGVYMTKVNGGWFMKDLDIRNHKIGVGVVDSFHPRIQNSYLWHNSVAGIYIHSGLGFAPAGSDTQIENTWISNQGSTGTKGDGLYFRSGGGIEVYNVNITGTSRGLVIKPEAGELASQAYITSMRADTTDGQPIYIDGSLGSIQRIQCLMCWASNSQGYEGVFIVGDVSGVYFDGLYSYLNHKNGVAIYNLGAIPPSDITITNSQIAFNSVLTNNTYSGVYVDAGVSHIGILNNRIGNFTINPFSFPQKTIIGVANNGGGLCRVTATAHGFATYDLVNITGTVGTVPCNGTWYITKITDDTFDLVGTTFSGTWTSGGLATNYKNAQSVGIEVAAGAGDNLRIIGNDLSYNLTGPIGMNATGQNIVIANNIGIDTTARAITANTTVYLPADITNSFIVSGTTTIQNIINAWNGRFITLIFADAAPGGVATGGNISTAATALQNGSISMIYYGSTWYVITATSSGGGGATNGTIGQGLTSNGSGGFGTPVTLAASATTDATNATNIGSGTLAKARGGAGADMSSVTFPASGTLATTAQLPTLPLSKANGGSGADNSSLTFPASGTLATTAQLPGLPVSKANGGTGANNSSVTFPASGTIMTTTTAVLPAQMPTLYVKVGAIGVGSEDSASALTTANLTNHSFVINDAKAKTLTEASCVSDAGDQSVTVKIGGTTLFTIHCIAYGSYSRATVTGATGYINAANMSSTAVAAGAQLDLSGTTNNSTKSIVLHVYGSM